MLQRALSLARCYFDIKTLQDQPEPTVLADFALAQPIAPLQVRNEIVALMARVRELRPRSAIEIGTAAGGTLFMLCRCADPTATIVSVDMYGGHFGAGYHWAKIPLYRSFARGRQTVKLIRGDSHTLKTVARVRNVFRNTPVDYLFIDGDHTYDGVKRDFELYSPLVRSGGMIALHDIAVHPRDSGCTVDRFWNELKCGNRHLEIIESASQGWGGIGLIYV